MEPSTERKIPDYEVTLKTRKGKYYFYIRELQIPASGDTLDSAYKELMRKKDELIKELEETDSLDELPQPVSKPSAKQGFDLKNLGMFSLKTLIVGLICGIILTFAGIELNTVVSKIGVMNPGNKLEEELYRAVDHEISPERQEKIIKSIRVIVKRLKPFVDEIKPLFSDDKNGENGLQF